MHCGFLLSSDPHHMLMPMTRVLMATMRILLQQIVVMAKAMVLLFVSVVLFPLAPSEFLFSRMMDWVSLSFPFPDLRVILMLWHLHDYM
jgi:hypothetical protein